MAVPCHERTENQRRYREKERKSRAAGALESARLAHAHHLAQDQAQIDRSGVNQEPLQNIGVATEVRAPHAASLVKMGEGPLHQLAAPTQKPLAAGPPIRRRFP